MVTTVIGIVRRLIPWIVAFVICVCSAEICARLDDWVFQGTSFFASPDRDRDLIMRDSHCVRGRPNGQFKKFKLNGFGFRGPEISKDKLPQTLRIVILGASETFGLYETDGQEFPAVLSKDFAQAGDNVEIINAAVAGMSLPTLLDYWNHWIKQFRADVVVIYPSPQFYLDDKPPHAASHGPVIHPTPPSTFRSRVWERISDSAKQSDLIKLVRVRYLLARDRATRDSASLFREVPSDRVDQFIADLENLMQAVERSGAKPVLVTHAFKTSSPPEAGDLRELDAFRIFFPRAEPAVIPAFNELARERTIGLAETHGWPVIDAAAELAGKRKCFADPVHFNDDGSTIMASLLARELRPLIAIITDNR